MQTPEPSEVQQQVVPLLLCCGTAVLMRHSLHVVTDNAHRGPLEIVGISRATRLAEHLWVTSEFQI